MVSSDVRSRGSFNLCGTRWGERVRLTPVEGEKRRVRCVYKLTMGKALTSPAEGEVRYEYVFRLIGAQGALRLSHRCTEILSVLQ